MPSKPEDRSYSHWWPRYVADYRAKTGRLSIVEHGVYTLLLDEYYISEKPLPKDPQELYRICRAMTDQEQNAVMLIINTYFSFVNGAYQNKKAEEQIARRLNIKEKRQNAANIRHAHAPAHAPAFAYNSLQPTAYSCTAAQPTGPQQQKINGKKSPQKILFTRQQIDAAKIGEPAYDPATTPHSILPGAWLDYAASKNIPQPQIYRSWQRFMDTAHAPFEKSRWNAWIDREKT